PQSTDSAPAFVQRLARATCASRLLPAQPFRPADATRRPHRSARRVGTLAAGNLPLFRSCLGRPCFAARGGALPEDTRTRVYPLARRSAVVASAHRRAPVAAAPAIVSTCLPRRSAADPSVANPGVQAAPTGSRP